MPKILITGATGLLGRSVNAELSKNARYDVIGLGHTRGGSEIRKADLTSKGQIDSLLEKEKPQVVIHCAAERRPDVSENDPDATTLLNVETTRNIAEACRSAGSWLIYISTDYVFDGTEPPYSPASKTNPLNHYGATKLAGEKAVHETLRDYLILRVPVLFGQVEKLSESAVTTIAHVFDKQTPQKIDDWAIRFPTSTDDVAVVISQIVERKLDLKQITGVYHWSNDEALTKYEMARIIGEIWEIDSSFLSGDSEEPQGAPRPRNCQLDTSQLEELGIGSKTPFKEAIARAIESFNPKSK